MKKIKLFSLTIVFTALLHAQDNRGFQLSFNHMALSIKDVNRSAEFYSSVLMLSEITNRTKMEGIRWFTLAEGGELHLISVIKENVNMNKAVHMGLTTIYFDQFLKRITELRIPDPPVLRNQEGEKGDILHSNTNPALRNYDADLMKELRFHNLQMNGSRRSKFLILEKLKTDAADLISSFIKK